MRLHAVVAVFAVLLAFSAVSGAQVLELAHSTTGGAYKDFLDQVIAEFEAANPGVTIVQNAMGDETYETTGLLALFQAGTPPDIFFQWGGWLVERDAQAGYSADLTDFVESTGLRNQISEAAWSESVYQGRVHLIPRSMDITNVIWYNKAMFAQHDLDPPATWDDFLNVCRTLRSKGITPLAAGNRGVGWPMGNWGGHIAARVVGEEAYDATLSLEPGTSFSDPDWVLALGLIQELVENDCFNPGVNAITDAEARSMFFVGAAAMHPIGSWLVPSAERDAPNLDYDAFDTPAISFGKGDQTSMIGLAVGYSISPDSPHQDVAKDFLAYFVSQDVQRRQVRETGVMSPVIGTADAADLPQTQALIELMERSGMIVSPPDTGYELEVAYAFYNAVAKVLDGVDPAQALEEADAAIAHLRN